MIEFKEPGPGPDFPSRDASTWARIAEYLDQVLDLETEQRAEWLNELEKSQADIAQILREMLDERRAMNTGGLLGASPVPPSRLDTLMRALAQNVRDRMEAPDEDWLKHLPHFAESLGACHRQSHIAEGAVLGPYRLVREIGHGGMSSVWLAERCDGHLKREVALKLPFEGPRQAQIEQRFRRERDILASLVHPNIARLYDAGADAHGQAYLAMEYVPGIALTRYCDARCLTIRERVRIFLQVLAAVEFAHTQLVLHRDLKPSNMLVTPEGRVVLLDFGIAKLLSPETNLESPLTEMAERMLTLDYASPEHIAGHALGTASDVYSLGIVLCELLTGARPFGAHHESRRALEETILTQSPTRPSQLEISEETAAARGATRGRLAQQLHGDLDTIVLKSLKKAPIERYRSIDAFAKDLSNYLDDLPVSARPDSPWYRFRRFVSRHRLQVAAATAVVLAIVAGAGVALWQAQAAARERDNAVALASRNGAMADFMNLLITEAAFSDKPVTVSELLARSEELALAGSSESREDRAAILGMIGGLFYSRSGNVGKSMQLLDHALSLVADSTDSRLKAQLTCDHAVILADTGKIEEASRALHGQLESPDLEPYIASSCLGYLARIAQMTSDPQGQVNYAMQALDRFRKAKRQPLMDEGTLLSIIGNAQSQAGNNLDANRYFERALQKYVAAGREHSPHTFILLNNWAQVSSAAGNPRHALDLYDRALSLAKQIDPNTPPPAIMVYNRARTLEAIGRYADAHSAYEFARQLAIESKSKDYEASSLLGLAAVAERSGDRAAVTRYLGDTTAVLNPSPPPDYPIMLRRAALEGRLALSDGRLDEARAKFDRVLAKKKSSASAVGAAIGKAEVDLLAGDPRAAVEDAQAVVNIAESMQGGLLYSNYTGESLLILGRAFQAAGDSGKARKALADAVAHLSNTVDENHPELLQARELLASIQ